jgi:hypothetical protein
MQRTLIPSLAAVVLALAALPAPASAQRVFVAALGADTNPCSFSAPCRTFQRAHDVVAAGGEIDVLDPAGYGPVTITKPISIQGHGFAGISVPQGNFGVTISAGETDAVSLNGLLIDGTWLGNIGIEFVSGGSLIVANCVVRRMVTNGINFISNTITSQSLSVSDTYLTDNGNFGILVQPNGAGTLSATMERVSLFNNQKAINLIGDFGTGAVSVTVTDSIVANNLFGASVVSNHAVLNLLLMRTAITGNSVGLNADGGDTLLWLTGSAVTGNVTGFTKANNGGIITFGDNYIDSNRLNNGTLSHAVPN